MDSVCCEERTACMRRVRVAELPTRIIAAIHGKCYRTTPMSSSFSDLRSGRRDLSIYPNPSKVAPPRNFDRHLFVGTLSLLSRVSPCQLPCHVLIHRPALVTACPPHAQANNTPPAPSSNRPPPLPPSPPRLFSLPIQARPADVCSANLLKWRNIAQR